MDTISGWTRWVGAVSSAVRKLRTAEVEARRTVRVDVPVHVAYDYVAELGHLPRFVAHVASAELVGPELWRWRVVGSGGREAVWEVLARRIRPSRLSWKTQGPCDVSHEAEVRFRRLRGGTRIDIRVRYQSAAGRRALADLLGRDPGDALDESLVRLRALLEGLGPAPLRGNGRRREG